MERDLFLVCQPFFLVHFNSHAHVERDVQRTNRSHKTRISTHTLTWSVTAHTRRPSSLRKISTHTLTWSVTPLLSPSILAPQISTHTLTWSVTGKIRVQMYFP